jgi:tetratricopeptide (TPR) repeat protein
MWLHLRRSVMLPLFFLIAGCRPSVEGQSDEQNNSSYRAGKEKLQALDYKGALAAFDRAVEQNPRSALAHYELGLLYDQQENDYPAALYHYNKALQLRPNGYPADNIRQRIPACRQELIKADSLSVLNPAALRETERLREENQRLRREIDGLRAQLASRPIPAMPNTNRFAAPSAAARSLSRSGTVTSAPPTNSAARSAASGNARLTTLPPRADSASGGSAAGSAPLRTHSVKAGETAAAIARQYGVPLNALLAANPTLEPKRMKIGQALNIPSS